MKQDRFEGCLLGLALGDAFGAPFEGGPIERLLWRVIGRTRDGKVRWTDDTSMSLDVGESLLAEEGLDLDALALRFARSYRWSRGYGPGAAKLLKRIARGADWREANRSVFPDGSFGNGGGMRAPVLALYFGGDEESLTAAARESASITHAHPLGMEGAVLIANATALCLQDATAMEVLGRGAELCQRAEFKGRIGIAADWIDSRAEVDAGMVRKELGNGMAAAKSCVTALYLALRFRQSSFDELLAFGAKIGGDVDTIGAMSGALWGAARGAAALPEEKLAVLEQRERISQLAQELHRRQAECGPT